jgi:hypothetical protein
VSGGVLFSYLKYVLVVLKKIAAIKIFEKIINI